MEPIVQILGLPAGSTAFRSDIAIAIGCFRDDSAPRLRYGDARLVL
jgi:hypothetical protein